MDALTEVINSTRARGGVFLDAQFCGPWWVSSKVDTSACAAWTGQALHVAAFHHIVAGDLVLEVPQLGVRREVAAGDSVILPFNHLHQVGNDPRLIPMAVGDLVEVGGDSTIGTVRQRGTGSISRMICGFIGFDIIPTQLFAGLPPVLVVQRSSRSEWVAQAHAQAAEACLAGLAGADAVVARLAEIEFVMALRQIAESAPSHSSTCLSAVADPVVGKALSYIHTQSSRPWTVETLACAVGVSRTVLAEKFSALVGTSPIAYLQEWRLNRAATALSATDDSVARIAELSGYQSEAAFSRAFRKMFNVPPSRWRAARRGTTGHQLP